MITSLPCQLEADERVKTESFQVWETKGKKEFSRRPMTITYILVLCLEERDGLEDL